MLRLRKLLKLSPPEFLIITTTTTTTSCSTLLVEWGYSSVAEGFTSVNKILGSIPSCNKTKHILHLKKKSEVFDLFLYLDYNRIHLFQSLEYHTWGHIIFTSFS